MDLIRRSDVEISFFQKCNHSRVYAETTVCRCASKYLFLKISQSSQEKTCARVSFDNVRTTTLFKKKDFGTGVFLWVLNTFVDRTPPVVALVYGKINLIILILQHMRESGNINETFSLRENLSAKNWCAKWELEKYFS